MKKVEVGTRIKGHNITWTVRRVAHTRSIRDPEILLKTYWLDAPWEDERVTTHITDRALRELRASGMVVVE